MCGVLICVTMAGLYREEPFFPSSRAHPLSDVRWRGGLIGRREMIAPSGPNTQACMRRCVYAGRKCGVGLAVAAVEEK